MTSWRRVRPVPRGACTATHLPGCWGFFPRGSHDTSPRCHLQCPGGPGRARMPLPSSTSRAPAVGLCAPIGAQDHRAHGVCSPAPGRDAASQVVALPPGVGQGSRPRGRRPEGGEGGKARGARPGDGTQGCAWLTCPTRPAPPPRAPREGGRDGSSAWPARSATGGGGGGPSTLGGPGPLRTPVVPAGDRGRPGHSRLALWKRRSQASACAGGEGERRCRGPPEGQPGQKARRGRGGRARLGLPVGAWQVALCAHRRGRRRRRRRRRRGGGGGAHDKLATCGLACWRGLKGGGAGALGNGRWVGRPGRPGGEAPEGQRKKKGFPDRESNPGRGGESAES